VPKSHLGWHNLPHLQTLPPPVTAKLQVVIFQEMRLRKGQMAMEGNTLRKGRF